MDTRKLAEEIARTATLPMEGSQIEYTVAFAMANVNVAARILPLLERAREEWVGPLEKALRGCTDDKAERLAEDMDHANKDHSCWYKAVKRARKLLAPAPQEEKRDV